MCRPPWRLQALELNAPRVEAYLRDLGARYILVNIPSAQLEAVSLGTVYSRHNVVVGKPERPSPAVASRITEINFNPYWNVPVSIVERDLIPKLLANKNAMSEMKILLRRSWRAASRPQDRRLDDHAG